MFSVLRPFEYEIRRIEIRNIKIVIAMRAFVVVVCRFFLTTTRIMHIWMCVTRYIFV